MKHLSLSRALLVGAATLASLPATAGACAVCMGDVNSRTAPAINNAIFFMLGCIGFTLASLAAFAFCLIRRANAPLPPHVELTQSINPPEDAS